MKRRCFVIGIHKETIPITAGTATQCCSVILTHSVTTRCGVWDEGRLNAAVYCDGDYNKQISTITITAYTAALLVQPFAHA